MVSACLPRQRAGTGHSPPVQPSPSACAFLDIPDEDKTSVASVAQAPLGVVTPVSMLWLFIISITSKAREGPFLGEFAKPGHTQAEKLNMIFPTGAEIQYKLWLPGAQILGVYM